VRVLSVVGNRPQFVKSAPVSAALRRAEIEEIGLHTGQHWDCELSDVFYEELGLPEPRHPLDLQTADAAARRAAIAAVVAQERPDWVLVFDDTNSTLAGAQAAGDAGVPLRTSSPASAAATRCCQRSTTESRWTPRPRSSSAPTSGRARRSSGKASAAASR
jgi:hypothetical protein